MDQAHTSTAALVARVQAGVPLEVASDLQRIDLNLFLTKGKDSCLLIRVEGESMNDLGIRDGDWVLVDTTRRPSVNQIVLARLNGEITLKRFKPESVPVHRLFLVPANPAYREIEVQPADEFAVIGVVTHIIHEAV